MRRFNISVNGTAYDVAVDEIDAGAPVATPTQVAAAPAVAPEIASGTEVRCPMPGTIVDVKVNAGDSVSEGQILVVLEAMKMENEIVAPVAGKIASVATKKGDSVNSDDLLIIIA